MAPGIRDYFCMIKDAGNDFIDDNATKLSASLAYYTIFSIGPLLLVIITLLGFFYKKADITTRIFYQLGNLVGQSGAEQLRNILDNISKQSHTTIFGIIGVVVPAVWRHWYIYRDTGFHQLYLVHKSEA